MAFGSKDRRIEDLEAREAVHVRRLEEKDAEIERLTTTQGRKALVQTHLEREAALTRVAELEQQLRDQTGEFVAMAERLAAAEAALGLQAKGDGWEAGVAS